jgi:hypothetical protein
VPSPIHAPAAADEATTLLDFLDHFRDTLRRQTDGLDADPDWEMTTATDDSPEELRRLFDAEVAAAEAIYRRAIEEVGLGVRAARKRHGEAPSLRWVLAHLVGEYARHCGHADLIRESVDGTVDL